MCLHCFAKEIEKSGMGQVVVLEMTKDGLRPAELNPSTDKAATTETKAAANQFLFRMLTSLLALWVELECKLQIVG